MVAPPRSPLHSHPEGHFHVLPSPDLHLIIIGTDVLKVGLGDGEEAAGKRRGSGETEGEASASWGWGEDKQKPGVESSGLGARLPLAPSPCPQSASFLLSWDAQPLFHYLIHSANVSGALMCSFPPSGTRSRRDVIIITLFEKALIHSFQAGYVKHGPPGPMLPISHAAEKVLVG